MKIENEMKYSSVKEALIRWVLGTDGQDGKTCKLINVIPWGEEISSVISWNDVCGKIYDSFGSRTDEENNEWDIGAILTYKNEFERFNKFITEKTNNVVDVYKGIIDKANSLYNKRFEIIVYKFIGVENSVAKYEPLYHYFDNTLTSIANKVYNGLQVSDLKNDDFVDSVHYGFYTNSRISFNSELIDTWLVLEVKKNF